MPRIYRTKFAMSQFAMDGEGVAASPIVHSFLSEGVRSETAFSFGCGCAACALTDKSFKAEAANTDGSPSFFTNQLGPQFAGDDIADNITTTTTLAIGSSLSSSIQTSGDLDYIRVSLVAGQTYTFSLVGAPGGLADAYVELRNSAGALVAENDDGGINLNSFLMYRATQTGDFYVVARGFDGSSTGNYTLSANVIQQGNTSPTNLTPNNLPFFSWDEAAIQITRTGASWATSFGASAVVTYSFRSTAPATMPDDTAGFTRFNAAQIAAAEAALAAWASVANITFVRVNDGDGYSNNASIVFGNYSTGAEGAAAFAYLPTSGNTASSNVQGDVWINSSLSYNANPVSGDFGPQVLLHEIGHALGLSHPGDYNAAPGVTITYGANADYYADSRMFTVMSYFASSNTNGNLAGFAALPQLHDIAAIQRLYGANLASRAGDTIYGFGSNTGVPEYTLSLSTSGAVFAIWDGGGIDTLNLSGYSTPSTIDLRQEAFSSAGPANGGLAIFNISIARGAIIENAVGGSGADTIIGNNVANRLTGAAGADSITGGLGVDTSVYSIASTGASWVRNPNGSWTVTAGGDGTDTVVQVEFLDFTDRDVFLDGAMQTLSGDGTSDILFRRTDGLLVSWNVAGATLTSSALLGSVGVEWAALGTGDLNGDGRYDLLWQRNDGLIFSWEMNGSSIASAGVITGLGAGWSFLGAGDFNRDLNDDLVWRNDASGLVVIWQMNNRSIESAGTPAVLGAEWSLDGIGDFNGDGRDDFLWRRDDGLSFIWEMNGTGVANAYATGAQTGTDWSIAGVGDTNGDGRDDIIWQRDDGLVVVWTMNGGTVASSGILASVSPAEWSIVDVGDYNGDGRDDLLFQNQLSGTVFAWMLNGTSIQSAGAIATIGGEWSFI